MCSCCVAGSELDDWGSEHGLGMSLGSDLSDQWIGFLQRFQHQQQTTAFARAIREVANENKGAARVRGIAASMKAAKVDKTVAPKSAYDAVPLLLPKKYGDQSSLSAAQRLDADMDADPAYDTDDDEETLPFTFPVEGSSGHGVFIGAICGYFAYFIRDYVIVLAVARGWIDVLSNTGSHGLVCMP